MRSALCLVALLTTCSVVTASVADNPAICADEGEDQGGSCSMPGDRSGAPAVPHTCSLCPCHTPVNRPVAKPPFNPIAVVAEFRAKPAAAPESLDAPAPPTPPPTSAL